MDKKNRENFSIKLILIFINKNSKNFSKKSSEKVEE